MSGQDDGSSKKNIKDPDALSELLDDALKGFSERPRTTDDELDEIMAAHDQAAAQKAAGDFQQMLQQMVKVQEEALRQAETTGQQVTEVDKEAQDMIEAMKALMESSGKIANATNHNDFLAGLDMLKGPDSPMEPFMSMILQILGKICFEFENQADQPPPTAQNGNESGLPDMSNFETLGKLLVELQAYGYPPKELTGELPAGWTVDDQTGLPKVEDISAAANACTLM
ncbi:unnamed protein product [Haemonchus placei]|uniref:Peroxin-19 n=1 Tax=Haemonchus placei TaxID=6290 RepID=A0A158QLU7_HAEPC|nr:unnamed protein product [Haemonchus placei]